MQDIWACPLSHSHCNQGLCEFADSGTGAQEEEKRFFEDHAAADAAHAAALRDAAAVTAAAQVLNPAP